MSDLLEMLTFRQWMAVLIGLDVALLIVGTIVIVRYRNAVNDAEKERQQWLSAQHDVPVYEHDVVNLTLQK